MDPRENDDRANDRAREDKGEKIEQERCRDKEEGETMEPFGRKVIEERMSIREEVEERHEIPISSNDSFTLSSFGFPDSQIIVGSAASYAR